MNTRGPWVVDLYRRALQVLLPEPFRRRYAAGMEAMFRDEWMARGRFRRVGLLARAGLDVVWTACVERVGLGTGITRGEDGTMWSNGIGMDLRTTLRALRRAPLFTLAAVSSLAVGFGGVATVYALADHLLFDPIAGVEAPDELVEITPGTLPYPVVQDYQQGLRSVAGVAAHRVRTVALEVGNGFDPRPVGVGIVTGNYFDLLGVTPTRGRLLTPADSITGAAPVTVLAHSLWTEMGEPEDVLGAELRINGSAFRVVGVAPEGFSGLRLWSEPALWIPVETWPEASLGRTPHVSSRNWGWLAAVARLAPGTDLANATDEVRREAARIGQEHPENEVDPATIAVVPSRLRAADQGGAMLTPLLSALGAMALLALFAAAANVANLLVSRAIRRHRELSVRAALGAGRVRLARLVVIEGGVLVSLGAAAGLAISWVLLRVLASVSLPGGIRLDTSNVAPDPAMMALAGGLLTVIVMVTALAPMLAAGRVSSASAGTARSSGPGPHRTRMRSLLSGVQLAVGVVLLTGTLLFGRSLVTALGVDLGFDPERLAVIELNGLLFGEDTSAGTTAVDELVRQVRQRSGIEAVSWASAPPLSQGGDFETFDIVGRAWPDRTPSVEINEVGSDFFTATGIPLVAGDAAATTEGLRTPVLVVSEAMAEQYWPGESPIGTHVQIAGMELPVVAIAADTRFHGHSSDPRPTAYGVFPAPVSPSIAVLARGPGVHAFLRNARDLVGSVDRRLVVAKLATGPGLIEDLLAPQRFGGGVALLFAALSLTLCVTGIYGVVAYGVAARFREFGVRLTLGAEPGRVAGEVVLRSLGPTILGLVTGALASAALTRVAARFLFGIESGDWLPAAAAAGLVFALALLATWLPARRAGRVDPATVLSAE